MSCIVDLIRIRGGNNVSNPAISLMDSAMANRNIFHRYGFNSVFQTRVTFGKAIWFIVVLWILATYCLSTGAQDFYETPDYIGSQIETTQSHAFPSDVQDVPFFSQVPIEYGSFPYYPQTVEGYSPSFQFQNAIPNNSQNLTESFNSSVFQGENGQYRILGDIATGIPIGNSQYDAIPVLEDSRIGAKPQLPELKIPLSVSEFNDRVDALKVRFSKLPLTIERSTPGRLLRYSLIGGADQTFLAPQNNVTTTGDGETTSQFELKPMYALGALCWNYPCANRRIMRCIDNKPAPTVGFGFQSQRGEFLATLAFAQIDRNYELRVDDKNFTVQDLVEWEKYSCSRYANLSLVAIGLAHYSQNPDETWTNAVGETLSLARVLEQESQRPIDWETAESTNKLLAFTYMLARLKTSVATSNPQLSEALQRTESFLVAVKNRVWEIIGDKALSSSLFFRTNIELTTPYMTVYVNGKLLRWVLLVSSPDEIRDEKMKRAMFELCALVDQLFNSVDDLDTLSAIDEETLAIAMQTLITYKKKIAMSNM